MDPPAADSLQRKFFGVDPQQLIEDVYNAGDDLICDGMDELERVLLHTFAGKRAKAAAAAAEQPADLITEIKTGTDKMVAALQEAHVRPGDKFEVYCLMELFSINDPELRKDVEARVVERGDRLQLLPGAHVYSEAEQAALEADLARLEEEAKRQRRRARTLLRLHSLYARRVPEAEEAERRLGELLEQFRRHSAGGANIEEALPDFLREAQYLHDLCSRITATSPAAAGGGGGGSAAAAAATGASSSSSSSSSAFALLSSSAAVGAAAAFAASAAPPVADGLSSLLGTFDRDVGAQSAASGALLAAAASSAPGADASGGAAGAAAAAAHPAQTPG